MGNRREKLNHLSGLMSLVSGRAEVTEVTSLALQHSPMCVLMKQEMLLVGLVEKN